MSAKIRIATDKVMAGEIHNVTICVIAPKGAFLLLKQRRCLFVLILDRGRATWRDDATRRWPETGLEGGVSPQTEATGRLPAGPGVRNTVATRPSVTNPVVDDVKVSGCLAHLASPAPKSSGTRLRATSTRSCSPMASWLVGQWAAHSKSGMSQGTNSCGFIACHTLMLGHAQCRA